MSLVNTSHSKGLVHLYLSVYPLFAYIDYHQRHSTGNMDSLQGDLSLDTYIHQSGLLLLLVLVSACAGLVIQRLVFSPLASFPGPKLAAASIWYEFYYDVVKRGSYFREIARMHSKYGESQAPVPHVCYS